ncbi:MAG: hypothetical protein EHM58_09660 [Ignavibacteriae bacterium]|nr:MAG: hypothetical protein EHM58_09660 [Ignavibacteriota bacterium]
MTKQEERTSLLVLFAFAMVLRLLLITQKNLWFDEIFSWHITQDTFRSIIIDTAGDIHPPFYYFVLKIWQEIFGVSVSVLRTPSALFSAAAVFFIYPLSKRVLDISSSLLVIFLFSISPLNIYFAQEARMASLNLFLNAGAIYFLILLIEKTTNYKKFYLSFSFYLYTIFTLLALYTHYFSFFVLASELLYILFHFRKEMKKLIYFIPSYVLIAWGYSPWFNTMILQIKKGQSWRGGQTTWAVVYQFLTFIKDIGMGFYHRYINNLISYPVEVIIFIIIIIASAGIIKLYKKAELNSTGVFIVLLSSIPFLTAILISFKQWIEYFRYLSIIIPYILTFIVMGVNYFTKKIQYTTIVIFILINIFGLLLYFGNSSKNNDYRTLINSLSGDTTDIELYVYPHYFGWIIDYYTSDQIPPVTGYGWEFSMLLDTVNVHKPGKFWLVMDYHSMDSSKYDEYLAPILNSYNKTSTSTYPIQPNTLKLYLFERKK